MKKLICFILLLSSSAQATCDWKTGITPGPNDTFIYTKECHLKVGGLVKANQDLTQALQLKDLALTKSDERIQLWTKTAEDEQDRIAKLSSEQKHTDWLYFGLGVLTVIGTGFVTAKLIHP